MEYDFLIKRLLYANYDIVRFDIVTLTNLIELIDNLDDKSDSDRLITMLNNSYNNIFEDNVKEILLGMIEFINKDKNYRGENVIKGLKVIVKANTKKRNKYLNYINLIDKE